MRVEYVNHKTSGRNTRKSVAKRPWKCKIDNNINTRCVRILMIVRFNLTSQSNCNIIYTVISKIYDVIKKYVTNKNRPM